MANCSYYSNVMKQCSVIHEIQSEVSINPLRPYTPANEDKSDASALRPDGFFG